jgi:hypothetical protein
MRMGDDRCEERKAIPGHALPLPTVQVVLIEVVGQVREQRAVDSTTGMR